MERGKEFQFSDLHSNDKTLPKSVRVDKINDIDLDENFWSSYKEYLFKELSRSSAKAKLSYAKQYCHVLIQQNAQNILQLSGENRVHVMKALSLLSKFLAVSDRWKGIVQKYSLKWSNGDPLHVFSKLIDSGNSIDEMIQWVKEIYKKLPRKLGDILIYSTLTGLRTSESLESMALLRKDKEYMDKEKMILKHYSHPSIFIRRTKKAFISVVNEKILELVNYGDFNGKNGNGKSGCNQNNPLTYSALSICMTALR